MCALGCGSTRVRCRWTGYAEPQGSHLIWAAIHQDNCFGMPGKAPCREERVFTRLMHGCLHLLLACKGVTIWTFRLHASISVHIAAKSCLRRTSSFGPCELWGQNDHELDRRVLSQPSRVEDLYFTFLILVRAVLKARPYLTGEILKMLLKPDA